METQCCKCKNDTAEYKQAEVILENLKKANAYNWPGCNGALGANQLLWLKKTLDNASAAGEKVMLFSHMACYPEMSFMLLNDKEVLGMLESYDCVKAFIAGHHHQGCYAVKNGIHHLTLQGMVDTDTNAYAIIEVYPTYLKVKGYGREHNRILHF